MDKIFVDTNVLVYSMDSHDPKKRDTSRRLLETFRNDAVGAISTQVVQEFIVSSTQKLHADPLVVKQVIHSFSFFELVMIDSEMIQEAIDIHVLNKVSFWDALIVAAAERAQCNILWSEDLNAGQLIRGIQIVNPYIAF